MLPIFFRRIMVLVILGGCGPRIEHEKFYSLAQYSLGQNRRLGAPVISPPGSGPGWRIENILLTGMNKYDRAWSAKTCPLTPGTDSIACLVAFRTIPAAACLRVEFDFWPSAEAAPQHVSLPNEAWGGMWGKLGFLADDQYQGTHVWGLDEPECGPGGWVVVDERVGWIP